MTIELRGITWSHPRGLDPLLEVSARSGEAGPLFVAGSSLRWDAQTLAGFESRPIAELADIYDLIVLDHPGLGAAVEQGLLVPLDELVDTRQLGSWRDQCVGRAFDAYSYAENQWALPIDAATQVSARRASSIGSPLTTWNDALSAATSKAVILPTLAPHTFLTFLGIAAAVDPVFEPSLHSLVPRQIGHTALSILSSLIRMMPPEHHLLDPIMILDRMKQDDTIDASPLLYGYVTYSGDDLVFDDAPRHRVDAAPGSVLGGTGLAISSRSKSPQAALAHLKVIGGSPAQTSVIPQSNGQPADRKAWNDPHVNEARNGFYNRTLFTQLTAWRRPRYSGWIACQEEASHLIYRGIANGEPHDEILDSVDDLYRTTRGNSPL